MTKANALKYYEHVCKCLDSKEYQGKKLPDTSLAVLKSSKLAIEKKYPELVEVNLEVKPEVLDGKKPKR